MAANPTFVPDWSWFNAASSEWARTLASAMNTTAPAFAQPILPGWTFNINSNNSAAPQTEAEVVQRYSYGRQLGRISDALLALIEELVPARVDEPAYRPFVEMTKHIVEMKSDAAAARVDQLRADLLLLKTTRPAEYERLRQSLRRTLDL